MPFLTPVPSIPPHAFFTHLQERERKNKTKTEPSMVKQQETELLCVYKSKAHSTGTGEKQWATWGQKASQASRTSSHAHTWSPEHTNQHLCPGSKLHSCTTPSTNANCAQEGTQSIIFLSPSSPDGGKERGPHLPVAIIISVFGLICPLAATYKAEEQSKDGTRFLSLCVSTSACLVLLGIEKASEVSKYPRYHQAKTFKESK